MILSDSPYPLESTTDADLRALSRVLWGWKPCSCRSTEAQTEKFNCEPGCPWMRHSKLVHFHSYYEKLASSYVPDLDYGRSPALRCHGDLLEIIAALKAQPEMSRAHLTAHYFRSRHSENAEAMPTLDDQDRAFSLAARVMTTVACSNENVASATLELGTEPITWLEETSVSQFLLAAFPLSNPLTLSQLAGSRRDPDMRSCLTAETIIKAGRLRLQPTDDLRNHLQLDARRGTLQIYQQTAVLKEHLRATQHLPVTATIGDAVSQGNIPRQLALEVIDSINLILFPPMTKSHDILRSLISDGYFDGDMLQLEMRAFRHRHECEGEYRYFASKLRDLRDEIKNPTPRSYLEEWFERRIAQRYFMMATLGGLLAAILLGILGLGIGIFQAWVGYQQWKHPTQS